MEAMSGIRVADFCWGIAGPVIGEMMALAGAEVIKIESMARMDASRLIGDPTTGEMYGINKAPVFNDANINKMSVRLNLKHPRGLELAKKLISISDVMLECFAPGVISRIGLGYDVVKGIRPGIVMLSLSGNGGTGPEAKAIVWGPVAAALGGLSQMAGYPDEPPTEHRWTGDLVGTYTGFLAAMLALVYQRRTGRGQYIDVSMREATTCLLGDAVMDFVLNCRVQSRSGNEDDIMAPHNCYRCQGEDRWVSIAVANDEEWAAMTRAMGDPAWARDARFADQYARWKNRRELDALVGSWTCNHTHYEVMHKLQQAGVAAVASLTPEDLAQDPHLTHHGGYMVMEHPEAGARYSLRPPWVLSRTSLEVKHDSPLFGEHTEYVSCQLLGLSKEEVQHLAEEKVLY